MKEKSISQNPVLDESGKILDIVLLKELIEKQTLIVRKLIDDLGIQVEDSDYKERNRIAKRILKALS